MIERKWTNLILNEAKNVGDAVRRRGFLTKFKIKFVACSQLMEF